MTPAASAFTNKVSSANQNAPATKPAAPAPIGATCHPPFNNRECNACHESGGGALRMKRPELCWTCHKDFSEAELGAVTTANALRMFSKMPAPAVDAAAGVAA